MSAIKSWVQNKLVFPAKSLTGSQIGLASGVGFWGGVFPIPALSTFATLFLSSVLMASAFNPAMTTIAIAINLVVTPIQIGLMPVFMDLPSMVAPLPSCSVSDLLYSIRNEPISNTIKTFGSCMFWAVVSWIVLAPLVIFMSRLIGAFLSSLHKRHE